MTRSLAVLVVLGLCGFGCRGTTSLSAVSTEPPPPQVEPALAPDSRLLDPRADALIREMSDAIAGAASFALEAEEIYDDVPEQSPRRQLTNTRHVALRRPNRLVGDAAGDGGNRLMVYDGKTFTAFDKEQNVWASGSVPDTIDGALDWAFDQTGTVVPLADFFYTNVYDRLMAGVQRGVYLGIHDAAGVRCHHLAFEQATVDWQIWIDAGEIPLPRKLVIAYKTEDEVPQYSVTIRKWNLGPRIPDALFAFEPPPGATRVDVPTLLQQAGAAPDSTEERSAEEPKP
jgi:hypothetical protein